MDNFSPDSGADSLQAVINALPESCNIFFAGLARNNEKFWFETYRSQYEKHILEPARTLVTIMGERLVAVAPDIIADPRVNGSIFRIYRDTRFSKNKTPYKTHLGLYFWEGEGKKLENSGFYCHFEPGLIMVGVGMYMFTRDALKRYRAVIAEPRKHQTLCRIVNDLESGGYRLGGQHYKRLPSDLDPQLTRPELWLHNGLYGSWETDKLVLSADMDLTDFLFGHFAALAPVHHWLRQQVL